MEQKQLFKIISATVLIFCFGFYGFAQQFKIPYKLGSVQSFVNTKMNLKNQKTLTINISNEESFIVDVESSKSSMHKYYLFGTLKGYKNATIFILGNDETIEGKILDYENKKAFVIITDDKNQVVIKEVDINKQVCVMDGWLTNEEPAKVKTTKKKKRSSMAIPQLESMPGADGVVYIDFDGENISGGGWGTINAQASSYTDAEIEDVWSIMAEDYAPYTINVTTKRSVYDNANTNSSQMIVFNETYPQQGGVALLNTFNGGNEPCWVNTTGIVNSVWLGSNVSSHESGHTFGLYHDGDYSGEYWLGHGNYNAIMGRANRTIVQWSKGEYQNANNPQDDIQIIEGANNVTFKTDDHGNDSVNSSILSFDSNNGSVLEVNNFGIIEERTDKDVFKITAIDGTIKLDIRPVNRLAQSPNLDIQARLLDASGNEITVSNPTTVMTATIDQVVTAGTYYIEIDGVGSGDPMTNGYSDYGSLGHYFISGSIPVINLGTKDFSLASTLIHPNPSSGQISIDFDVSKISQLKIEVLDVLGKQVYNNVLTSDHKTINLENLQKGMYFMLFSEGNNSTVKKILLK